MAARSFPADPTFVTASEGDVWKRLRRQLDGSTLLANFRLSDRDKDHEVDLVALMPGSGIVTIEVKGSHVWHDGQNWRIQRAAGPEVIHPVDQARDACYSLRRYVESDPRWGSRGRVRWSHHVVLANTTLADDFTTPDCPRWQVSGATDLGSLGDRIWDTTSLYRSDARSPGPDDIDLVREILTGRNLPALDPAALAEDRRALADRLTMEQTELLKVIRLVNRVEVRGGAGSGKTVLAQRQGGDRAARPDDRGGPHPHRRPVVRLDHHRRGPGLRPRLVAGPAGGLARRGPGRCLRLRRRTATSLQPVRTPAGQPGAIGARPQPAQYPPDRAELHSVGAHLDATARIRRPRCRLRPDLDG